MHQTCFWYALSIVLNKLMPDINRFNQSGYAVKVRNKNINGNIFNYIIEVDGILFDATYIFSSNTKLIGVLKLNNLTYSISHEYLIDTINKGIRVYDTTTTYHELFMIHNKGILDICVSKKRKQYVAVAIANSDDPDLNQYTVHSLFTDVPEIPISALTPDIVRWCFLVSGAINFKKTLCKDVIVFSNGVQQLIIYNEGTRQCIFTNIIDKSVPHLTSGAIDTINSDFEQFIKYSELNNSLMQIVEVLCNKQHICKRLDYQLKIDGDVLTECKSKKRFKITQNLCNIEFKQI